MSVYNLHPYLYQFTPRLPPFQRSDILLFYRLYALQHQQDLKKLLAVPMQASRLKGVKTNFLITLSTRAIDLLGHGEILHWLIMSNHLSSFPTSPLTHVAYTALPPQSSPFVQTQDEKHLRPLPLS